MISRSGFRPTVAVVASLLAAGLGLVSCKESGAKSALPPASGSGVAAPDVPKVRDLLVETADAGATGGSALSATGTLYAREEAHLGPKASGVLSAVTVKEGDRVKKGQLLFRLESLQSDLGVKQAKALLQAAEVGYRAAELDHRRTKELFDRGSVAAATFDQVQARHDSARSAVDQAKVALSMAQKASGDTAVYSPINGVVTAKFKSVGEMVTMTPPTVVLVVQDVSVLELKVRLPERALRNLALGSQLTASFPALGAERVTRVKRINPAIDVATRTVEIVADLDNKDQSLKPGMLADVRLGDGTAQGGPAPSAGAETARADRPAAASRKTP
jgi:RND family efflux transporter MFP subunit